MPIPADILAFSTTRAPWQQDLIRRVFTQPDLNAADLADIYQHLKANCGVTGAAPAGALAPLDGNHLPHRPAMPAATVLLSVRDIANTNHLAPGQCLPFAAGITVIYGDNGSGKSGYTRVLKAACRARRAGAEPVLGNVYAAAPEPPAEATISFVSGNAAKQDYRWREGQAANPILSRISVFDVLTAPLYADQQNEIEFLPQGLDVLPRVGAACDNLVGLLNAEIKPLEQALAAPPPAMPENTDPSKLVARLATATRLPDLPTADTIRAAATWDAAAIAELAAIDAYLAADPAVASVKCRRLKTAVETVGKVIEGADKLVNDAAIAKLNATVETARGARAAADLAAIAQFESEPLANGIGSDPWRMMFSYARQFFEIARPGIAFPVEAAAEPCPLCQQQLDGDAHARLCRFHAFIENAAQKEAVRTEGIVAQSRRLIEALQILSTAIATAQLAEFATLGEQEHGLADRMVAELDVLTARQRVILAAIARPAAIGEVPALGAVAKPEIDAALNKLGDAATEFDKAAADPSEREKKRAAKQALLARKSLSENLAAVLTRRDQLEHLQRLKNCVSACETRTLSLKNTDLRDTYITRHFDQRIQTELRELRLDYLPIKVEGRSERGKNYLGPTLEKRVAARTSNILSEGEFRGLALACFFAEIAGIDGHDGIIIDDPVSSLDHLHTREVAQRIIKEAQTGRQIIVFTHDLSFYFELWVATTQANVAIARHWLRYTPDNGYGTVFPDDAPWQAKDVRQRLRVLELRLPAIRAIADRGSDPYRDAVTNFYTDLRESWERLVEEKLLNGVTGRFQPGVSTQRLSGVQVKDEDHHKIFSAMRRISEHSGHDRARGREVAPPAPDVMESEIIELRKYLDELNVRIEALSRERAAKEKGPPKAQAG